MDDAVLVGVVDGAGDVNGDGAADVLTGPDVGGGPEVRVFGGGKFGGQLLRDFFAYSGSFLGGLRVAAADINGDGFADLITGTGPGSAPEVKVLVALSQQVIDDFFASNPALAGVFVGGR